MNFSVKNSVCLATKIPEVKSKIPEYNHYENIRSKSLMMSVIHLLAKAVVPASPKLIQTDDTIALTNLLYLRIGLSFN